MQRYLEKQAAATHPVAKQLLSIILEKKSNLSVSADLTQAKDLLDFADCVGPEICLLKTHIDILTDFNENVREQLQELARRHQFLIFEDRKFADIGNTVKHQYADGVYHIADWADIVNAHVLPGPGIIEGLKAVGQPKQRGLLLLAQMSAAGNLFTSDYTAQAVAMARQHKDFVMGFIAMEKLCDDPEFLYFTPGVKLESGGDTLGQQYVTPEEAITQRQTDVIIVGRGIYEADDPRQAAQLYRQRAWAAAGEGNDR